MGTLRLLPPVGLEELNTEAALQTRVDRKYVVPEPLARQLLATFDAEVRVLEMDGSRCFAYDSVYFDTAQLDSYLLAAHGRRRRYKVRTRTYVDSAISFLEVKTEGAREATVKERIPYDLTDRARLTAEGLDYVHETLAAAVGGVPAGPLGPGARNPLPPHHAVPAGVRQPGHHRHGRHLAAPRRAGLGPGRCGDPRDQVRLGGRPAGPALWAHGVRPSRISKFATGMAALCPDLPANRWNRTLRRTLALRPAA